jgi:hypothetical protein
MITPANLFDDAGQKSSQGRHEDAVKLLDQCICSKPTPDLAVQAYYCLFAEISFGMGIMEKTSNLKPEERLWSARAAECTCSHKYRNILN